MCSLLSFKQFLFESTYKELESNVLSFKPKTKKRQHAVGPLTMSKMDVNAALGVKTLRFMADVNGSTGNIYKVTVQFNRVNFDGKQHKFKAKDGKEYTIDKLDLNSKDVMLRCQCLDFYFRFGYYNWKDKSIYGNRPKKYVRKTDWWPPVNPEKVPGFCKHVIRTIKEIQAQGFVK